MTHHPLDPDAADAIRRHVLDSIAENRVPGFHLPGYLMGLAWNRVDLDGTELYIDTGPHNEDAPGVLNIAPLALLADIGLSWTARPRVGTTVRMATVNLHLQFTGVPLAGRVSIEGRFMGHVEGGLSLGQVLAQGTLACGGRPVAYAHGTFAHTDPPKGMVLQPSPYTRPRGGLPRLETADLDAGERKVYAAAEESIAAAADGRSFARHFWRQLGERTATGARCIARLGHQHTNRVGHAQGGFLIGMAVASALEVAPHGTQLASVSAWYVGVGEGERLRAVSTVIQRGRSLVVVRTQVLGKDRRRVLEVVSSHATVAHAHHRSHAQ